MSNSGGLYREIQLVLMQAQDLLSAISQCQIRSDPLNALRSAILAEDWPEAEVLVVVLVAVALVRLAL